jgi:HK97 family phage major capsid protein
VSETTTIRKALDIASGAGSYLIPEVVDSAIRDYISLEPTLYNIFPKVPWATNTYFIRKRTANPTASWSTDGGPLPAASQSAFDRVAKSVKYLYSRGEVTGPMQRAAGTLFNALAMEVEAHGKEMVRRLSEDIATATGGANDIEGLLYQTDTSDDFSAGGGLMASGDYLSLALIDEAIDNSRGEVDLIVTSRKVRRRIAALLQAQQQFVNTSEINAGFRVLSYDGIPIVTSLQWETDTDMLFVKRSDCKILVHQDFTYEDLAKTKDSVDFFIKWYGGFVVEGRPTHLTFNDVDDLPA